MFRSIAVLSVLAAFAAFADEEKPAIAVMELANKGGAPMESEAAGVAVARGLRELDAFEVISSDDLRTMLQMERQKQLLGMDSDGVKATATALGVRHTIVGSLTKVGNGFEAELRLLDGTTSKIVNQKGTKAESLEALLPSLRGLVQEVVGPLLAAEQGALLVNTREEGAEIIVDDVSRGSTPLAAPIALPRGRHRVVVKKDGFIARTGLAVVQKNELSVLDVTLVPSNDFVAAYRSRSTKMRVANIPTPASQAQER